MTVFGTAAELILNVSTWDINRIEKHIVLQQFGVIPIGCATLASVLNEYKSPADKVASLEKKGELIRLKKGLFVVSPDVHRQVLSIELIASNLYGPSYVSFEKALSF
ncbi:MAG: hypothetical protein ACOYN4_21585 [Bacteroidales bacterium]